MTEKKSVKQDSLGQPEVNIGLVGHVDHGKTTLTERLSGKWTDTHSEELKRGITIRLGYADATFYKDAETQEYTPKPTSEGGKENTPVRKVSFVDAPGHESLMATMLAGTTIMDGAILLVAANEKCPQPQTKEHLQALEISGIKNVIIVQNKIDLVSEERALKSYEQIRTFLKDTRYAQAPIIPISAQHGVNIHYLIQAIEEHIKTPERDVKKAARMLIARSFDINKPGNAPETMEGGILGGAVVQGAFSVGEEIEIRPGHVVAEANKQIAKPLFTKITEGMTGGAQVKTLVPGGSIAMKTLLDPSIVKSDALVGNMVGHKGDLPPVWYELTMETHLLERVVGAEEDLKVDPIKLNEILMLNVNSAATVGFVKEVSKNKVHCTLKLPVCAEEGSRVTISRRVGSRFRLIGYAEIVASLK